MRLFIAIPVEDALKQQLINIQNEIRGTGAHIRLVEPENIHLTVRFLGEINSEQSSLIANLIKKATSNYKRFEMELKRIGAFPSGNNPRVVWVGCHETAGENKLLKIYQDIEKGLHPFKALSPDVTSRGCQSGVPEPRLNGVSGIGSNQTFSPHITLGRVKSPKNKEALTRLLDERAEFSAGKQVVKEVVLFQSQLRPDGPVYSVVDIGSLAD